MLIDLLFLGCPLALGACLAGLAWREGAAKYLRPALCLFAYVAFYLAGGREVVLYLFCGLLMGAGWVSAGGGMS